jgi:glycolate oxidase iron-sulfur subunit
MLRLPPGSNPYAPSAPDSCIITRMIRELERLRSDDYQEKLAQCVHCGLCLQACPTYRLWGNEMDAPRGRIALMSAASGGRLSESDIRMEFSHHIDYCLACRSCESVCPSGVKYGSLVEQARIVVESNRKPGFGERFLRWSGTRQLMPYPGRLRFLARVMKIYQASGLQRLVRRFNLLPASLQSMESLLPPIELHGNGADDHLHILQPRGQLMLFTGCIQEGFLSQVNRATMRVLQRNGYEVKIPLHQTCCGAAHLHLGDLETARKLARENIDAFFSQDDLDTIICNAGGCGLALKEYPMLLAEDADYASRAQEFSARVQDINEFLADHLFEPPTGVVSTQATYADSCHLRHGQKIVDPPRWLLKQIPGLNLVELASPDQCCGSAGVYNLAHPEVAGELLKAKLADITLTGAELIITSNPGCQLQLIAGVRQAGLRARVLHVVEVIELAYQNSD